MATHWNMASTQPPWRSPMSVAYDMECDIISVPNELLALMEEPGKGLEQLREAHPWLCELEKGSKANLQGMRQAFLADGHTFMSVLAEFLNARKWQEFVAYCVLEKECDVVIVELLDLAFQDYHSFRSNKPFVGASKATDYDQSLKRLGYAKEGHTPRQRLLQSIRARLDEPPQFYRKLTFLDRGQAVTAIQAASQLPPETITSFLSHIQKLMTDLWYLLVEEMTFGYNVAGTEHEPWPLRVSPYWHGIGETLCSLGSLVGANVSLRRDMMNPVTIFSALKNVLNDEGVTVNIMLARIEEQSMKMRRQQQVITALQFRHLLEHLPRALRRRRITMAGEDAAEALKVATEWDRMSENERWLAFWEEAVKQVYDVYTDRGRPDWTPPPGEGQQDHKPSPFAKVLDEFLAEASKGRNSTQAVKWLARESIIGRRMKRLYSILSQIIHQFSDGEFTVDPLNFSPDDARLLAALVPEKTEVEDDEWKSEFRRYVWAKVDTKSTARPTAQAAASNPAASNPSASNQTASSQDLIDRAKRHLETFRTNERLRALLSGELTVASATSTANVATLNVQYKPVESDIDPLLRSVSLAALVDLVGHMGIAISGSSEQRVKGKHYQMQATNLDTVKAGEIIEILLSVSPQGKAKDRLWCVDVKMQRAGTAVVAKGQFKAWEVEAAGAG